MAGRRRMSEQVPAKPIVRDARDFNSFAHGDYLEGNSGLPFERAMAHSRMAVCLSDPHREDCPIVFVNQAFLTLTGFSKDDVIGKNCRFLQGAHTSRKSINDIRTAIHEKRVIVVELLNYRKDLTPFWNSLHIGPIFDDAGGLLFYFGNQWDISNEMKSREKVAESRVMVRELSHRMKNMFAVIAAIVNITGRSNGISHVARQINDRIQALGRAYEPTLDEANLGSISVAQAIRSIVMPYDPDQTRIGFGGTRVRADTNVVSLLGLVLHELATNAVKYGALSNDSGTVALEWKSERSPKDKRKHLIVRWTETGGPPVVPPDASGGAASGGDGSGRVGTGIGIMRTLVERADGSVRHEWSDEGLDVTISVPNDNRNADA